jgi:hypothetical protein
MTRTVYGVSYRAVPCEYESTVIDIGHSACLERAKMGYSAVRRLLGPGSMEVMYIVM